MDDATEPAWMEKFRSPESLGRAVRAAEVSSEEEENEEADAELTRPVLRESIGGVKEDDGGAGTSGRRRGNAVEDPFDAPVVEKTQTKTKSGDSPRKPSAPPPKPDGSSTRVDLVATSNLGGKSKVLFEIEGAGEAVDLDGDTGAVGRWLAESARSLKVDMKVENKGSEEVDFTGSFHTYFSADINAAKVGGLNGCKTFDRLASAESTVSGDISFTGPIDSVYYGVPETLTLATGKHTVSIKSDKAWTEAVVWTPWTDMEACYKEFACVESAACTPVVVAPGGSWETSTTISAA